MSQVIIGMDPHKRSATIEVMTAYESVAGGGRYGTGAAGAPAGTWQPGWPVPVSRPGRAAETVCQDPGVHFRARP
jgi:hypothetical protein